MKRTYRVIKVDGEYVTVEVTKDISSEVRGNTDAILWNDRSYQDANDPRFSSRKTHQEYMKQYGLTNPSDFKEEWHSKEKQRVAEKHGIDPSRKEDIRRVINTLNSRRR